MYLYLLLGSYFQKLWQVYCTCHLLTLLPQSFQVVTTKNYCKKDVFVFTSRQLLPKTIARIFYCHLLTYITQVVPSHSFLVVTTKNYCKNSLLLITYITQFLLTVSKQLLPKTIAIVLQWTFVVQWSFVSDTMTLEMVIRRWHCSV